MTVEQAARGPGIPRNLSRELIVDAALKLVREGGVAALSMRRLSAELDATVAITYHYFPNKSAVIEAVSDVVVDEIVAGDNPDLPWRQRLVDLMLAQNRELLRHPGIARFLVENHDKPAATKWTEAYLRVLLDAGFSPAAAAKAFALVSFYINPAFLIERPEVSTERVVDAANDAEPDGFPAIRTVQPHLSGVSFGAQYEQGVHTLVSMLDPERD
ncbi:MAG TPA: TetR/AcrR family transcriptional regulator [Jatrophihabitantaceae bacterium]|nr:TetR/AcrR family transcriptional regulator [Jatrophihabitantaceae bacterium]